MWIKITFSSDFASSSVSKEINQKFNEKTVYSLIENFKHTESSKKSEATVPLKKIKNILLFEIAE